MNIVWDVMRNTTLPSWISPPPRNWGTAKRGTLSANNWRVICTIHLPVTLIWIWRNENSRKIDLIQNFMDLVTAARIASLRRLLPVHIEEYNFHMTRYVKEIQVLYPSQKLKPTHHTAMHIGDTMENFGPDHSHNALFYERHIRELGLLNTNNKPGKHKFLILICCFKKLTFYVQGKWNQLLLNLQRSTAMCAPFWRMTNGHATTCRK